MYWEAILHLHVCKQKLTQIKWFCEICVSSLLVSFLGRLFQSFIFTLLFAEHYCLRTSTDGREKDPNQTRGLTIGANDLPTELPSPMQIFEVLTSCSLSGQYILFVSTHLYKILSLNWKNEQALITLLI